MASSPAPGATIAPAAALYLTFSKPVDEVLGSKRPQLSPATAGHWRKANSHTLEFRPSGYGMPLGSQLHLTLPRAVKALLAKFPPETLKPGDGTPGDATAARALTGRPASIAKLRGQQLQLPDGALLVVTMHPSALLRMQDDADKRQGYRQLVADLKFAAKVAEKERV